MAHVLCVLYDDPMDGYPPQYARDDIPTIERYPDGMSTPTPRAIDFTPGELLTGHNSNRRGANRDGLVLRQRARHSRNTATAP
jgi:hypothetical protein